MCGICGFCDFSRNNGTLTWRETGHRMGQALNHRGPDDKGLWQGNDCVLVHRRRGPGVLQPVVKQAGGAEYALVCDGALTNLSELCRALEGEGWTFPKENSAEALLCALISWGAGALDRVDGAFAFAFWDGKGRRLLCGRDPMGRKPLFYARRGETFLFASQPRGLFAYPGLEPSLGREGLCQVLGLGPARAPGSGIFEGVEELPPAHLLSLTPDGVDVTPYWRLESRPHGGSYGETVSRVGELTVGAVRGCLGGGPVGALLSGDVEDAVVTALAAAAYTEEGRPPLETYSLDWGSGSWPEDAHGIRCLADACHTRHRALKCGIPALANLLEESAAARDLPGMADLDTELLCFFQTAAPEQGAVLTGAGAAELLGGRPWFEREELLSAQTFPWCPDLGPRREVFRRELWEDLGVESYVQSRYEQSMAACPRLEGERPWESRRREVGWLTFQWYLPPVLERLDRMGAACGLEARAPFCDRSLVEYLWNVPYAMKAANARPMELLRDAARELLPEPALTACRRPAPRGPLYAQMVRARLAAVLEDPAAPIHALVDGDALRAGLLAGAGAGGRPWFGPAMAGPQMLAYLVQLNAWMERFGLRV